jgi:O-antigen/teichoic acid export membrane protein
MDGKDLRSLIGLGVPMMIIALFSSFFDTIDRLMISHYLGLEALGLYSIALMAYTYINSIPNAVGIVMIPNIQEKYGRSDQMLDLRGYLQKAELFFSSWIPVLIALAWFLGPPLIRLILPKFEAGIPAMRFLILSGYFVALVQAYSQFVYVIRKHMTLLPLFSLSCLAAAAFNYIAIKKGLGIEGVAMATTLASFFHYSIIMLYASRFVFSLSEIIKGYFIVVVKFASMLLCFMVIERMISMPSPIAKGLLGAAVFIGLFSPFLIQAEKKLGVLRQLRDKFIRK